MGYGGDILWTAVLRQLSVEAGGTKVRPALRPRLSDLLAGRLYDASQAMADRYPVFRGLDFLDLPEARPKAGWMAPFDRAFALLTRLPGFRQAFEQGVFRAAEARWRKQPTAPRLVHIDLELHSYAERMEGRFGPRKRFIWKSPGHAAACMARRFTDTEPDLPGTLNLEDAERDKTRALLTDAGIAGPFIAVSPGTNEDWFAHLRAWDWTNWVTLAEELAQASALPPLVEVGLRDGAPLPGAVDLRGKTTFREAAAVIAEARLFLGTDGGLMHAAAALGTPSVILWGGLNLPDFLGYPDRHRILHHRTACAPCGNLGWCDHQHACMTAISVADVAAAVRKALKDLPQGFALSDGNSAFPPGAGDPRDPH